LLHIIHSPYGVMSLIMSLYWNVARPGMVSSN
jgi:hypothetical protein